MANRKISELTIKDSPSTSATLVGVDNGETVQIPVDKFVTKNEDGGLNITASYIHMGQEDGKAIIDFLGDDDVEIAGNAVYITGLRALTAPDGDGSENLSHGNAGQVLMSNGDNVYWSDAPSGDTSNCVKAVNCSTDPGTTVAPIVDGMTTQGIGYGQLFLLNLNGYRTGSYLCTIKSYGGDTVNIHLLDLNTLKQYEQTGNSHALTISEVLDSEVTDSNDSSTKQVVKVDVMELLTTQNVDLFKALTELYMNGNIVIVASLDGVNVVVSYVDLISADEATWGVSLPIPTYSDEAITKVVTTTCLIRYKDGVLTYLTKASSDDSSSSGNTSSGGGASIIYTTELPSTPQQAIYVVTQDEVKKVEIVQSGIILPPEYGYVEVVDALPEFGTVAIDLQTQYMYGYYLTTDGILYGYIDTAFSELTGGQLPVGWIPISNLFVLFGATDGGLITSLDQATDESAQYFLLTTEPKTRVYVPMPDGAFLELTTGIRTRFDANNGTVSITEM